ncbi:unnamed protein product [Pleuronectes platessa]|uniref:Uncharacterized protein n=1 Tax=Pleuronectes platessa TaxID=8262 RepID=A0A9N7Y9E6_PLEPL|nr:unnamed protein product [Pleuronectes platessa]
MQDHGECFLCQIGQHGDFPSRTCKPQNLASIQALLLVRLIEDDGLKMVLPQESFSYKDYTCCPPPRGLTLPV